MSKEDRYKEELKKLGGVDFEIIKEEWGYYKLADGSLLKVKTVLVNVLKENREGAELAYSFSWTNVIGALSPGHLRGKPSPRRLSPEELVKSIVEEDIKFTTLKEGLSEYKLDDGTFISIKPILVMVSRTNKYDSKGIPIYLVDVQPVVKVKKPKR